MGGHGSLNPRHLSQVNSELTAGIRCCSDVSRGDVSDFLGDLLFQAINMKTMRVKMNSSLRKYRLTVNVGNHYAVFFGFWMELVTYNILPYLRTLGYN